MGVIRKTFGAALGVAAAAFVATRVARPGGAVPAAPVPGTPGRYGWRHAEIFFSRRGQGPPLVLLHDVYAGASGEEMTALGDRLAEWFSVFAVDLPGFGRSDRPSMRYDPDFLIDAIVEFVRHEVGGPAVIVGSGIVGALGAEAAVRLSRDALGVVLLGPPERLGADADAAVPWRPILSRALRPLTGSAGPLWSLWSGGLAHDAGSALARVTQPALIVWSSESRCDPAAPETYAAIRPDVPQRVIPGTVDRPHREAPGAVADAISAWWAGTGQTG